MIAVVVTNQQMRNTTNVLILSLALADLLFIVLCVPFTGVDYALSTTQGGDDSIGKQILGLNVLFPSLVDMLYCCRIKKESQSIFEAEAQARIFLLNRGPGLAVRVAVVQDGAVPHLHHQFLQHLHSHPDVHGQVSGRRVPGKSSSTQSLRYETLS